MTKNTCLPKGMKSRPIALLAAGLLWAGLAQAQESANASGGDATGSGRTVAYSVGQVVYTTNTSSTGSVAQGVQHAYEIFALGINEPALNISLIAFPNPTMGNLTLQISTQQTNGSKMNDKIKHCLQHLCLPLNQIQTDKHSIKLLVRGKNIRFF